MNATGPLSTTIFVILIFMVASTVGYLFIRAGFGKTRVIVGVLLWLVLSAVLAVVTRNLGQSIQFIGFLPVAIIGIGIAFTKIGTDFMAGACLATLAAVQIFRVPLELILDAWHHEGVVPIQLTYRGDNLDIVTGLLAVPVAIMITRGLWARPVAWAFNVLGLLFLFRIIFIVMLSSPTPLRAAFGRYKSGPDVLLGLTVPHIWIGWVAVLTAMALHTISLRHLWDTRSNA